MKRKTIKFCALVLVVALCVPLLLSGCGEKTLWVVSDAVAGSRRDRLITTQIKVFQDSHPGVTIEYERIPLKQADREVALERVRTATMAGRGPDIFLLSTFLESEIYYICGSSYMSIADDEVGLHLLSDDDYLFPDVQQAIRNGLFMDISKYYDADEELNKEELVPAVMEAGVYRNKRFVLPLRFDLPVAYVDVEQFEAAGFSLDVFDEGYLGLMKAVNASGNSKMARDCSIRRIYRNSFFNFFPELVDYENQEVILPVDELIEFGAAHHQLYGLQGSVRYAGDQGLYGIYDKNWHWSDEAALAIAGMDTVVANAAISKLRGIDLAIIPLTASDGTLIADVTQYGAIGKGCNNPKIAYEFLRRFLLESSQWENSNKDPNFGTDCMPGWPVRTVNAAQKMFSNQCDYYKKLQEMSSLYKSRGITKYSVSDEELPDWHEEIDLARFSLPIERTYSERLWYGTWDPETLRIAGYDVESYVSNMIKDFEWHLGEG